ncbi:MAG TPA: hypothetical protein VHC98_02390 [Candidatus Saccharimonadales bacterium]|nr:hypothetical protein [Candidatus Saccharimonadales bacterium]
MHQKLATLLRSPRFFVATVGLLVVQAAWIALTARYPQAFDEQYHFGIIQAYAHQWSPFFAHQPANSGTLGALTANPSFLYHYLMSFPYRLIALFTASQTVQIVLLRFINIALLTWGLVLFRKLLLRATPLTGLVHAVLFCFIFIPVVPLLAAQINYDNLMIPLAALGLLWAVDLAATWRKERTLSLELTLRLVVLGLLASLVKYPFLPFFAAFLALIAGVAWQARHRLGMSMERQYAALARWKVAAYALLLLAGSGLCLGSYGRFLVQYHSLTPSCSQALSVQACQAYAPYGRNYAYEHDGQPKPTPLASIPVYAWKWVTQSVTELVFSIGSMFDADGVTVDYDVATPLPVMAAIAWTILITGAIAAALCWRRLWRSDFCRVVLLTTVLYVGALWVDNYSDYLKTGYPVAIHGRYLLPLLPALLVAFALSYYWLLQRLRLWRMVPQLGRGWLVIGVLLVAILQGGGCITYILRSDPTWFWQQNTVAAKVNEHARQLLSPLVIGS